MISTKTYESPMGSVIISIIFGLGLAALFRQTCKGERCIIVQSPNVEDIRKHVYKFQRECYKYTPEVVQCPQKSNPDV